MNLGNYDRWKTTPPDELEPKEYCSHCGEPLYEGDALYDISGEIWCEDCLNDEFRRFV